MPESLFLTVNLIDRYLAVRQVTRKNLQLVRLKLHHHQQQSSAAMLPFIHSFFCVISWFQADCISQAGLVLLLLKGGCDSDAGGS